MNYTLHQLKIFLTVSRTLSVTRASKELHMSQPAVSMQLRNFQEQFDIPLTEIIGRKIHITDFGKEIATAAEYILKEVEAINMKNFAYQNQLVGRLKIAVVSTGKYVMPYFLSAFMRAHPGVNLSLDVTNKNSVVENLENNEIDFALVSVLPDHLQIESIGLMENKLFLVGGREQELKLAHHSREVFREIPLIYREQGSGTRHVMESFMKQHNLPILKKMELTSNEAVKQAVIAGLGYSVVPIIGIKNELRNGDLEIIPVGGFPIKSNWQIIWMKGKKFSPAASAYLEYVEKEKSKIIKEKFGWFEKY
ncbi:LysR family transcriptional regulator [Salegentibacter sp. F188]|uniref:LysR family transcriptional regulator n=1 Tax=Autumnicola patrickiae TaxID=3075591 RepID=A0ABU3DZB3_9FLAO|nr:LysR family transcriptional regulator [Salegentibacter sp. F188]MDT0688799.1 LysR family transcriptional regulator [Salegentibacter sp. F188]